MALCTQSSRVHLQAVPEHSSAAVLTPGVARDQELWDRNATQVTPCSPAKLFSQDIDTIFEELMMRSLIGYVQDAKIQQLTSENIILGNANTQLKYNLDSQKERLAATENVR